MKKSKNKNKKPHHESFLGGKTHAQAVLTKPKKQKGPVIGDSDGFQEEEATWIYTYGDLVTLLLLFFIMLFAISTISEEKFQALKEAIDSKKGKAIGIIDKLKKMSKDAQSSGDKDYIRKVKIGNGEDIELAQEAAQTGRMQISQLVQSLEELEKQMKKNDSKRSQKTLKQIKNNLKKEVAKQTPQRKQDFKELIIKVPHRKIFGSGIDLSGFAKSFISSISHDFKQDKNFKNIHIQVTGSASKNITTTLKGRVFKMNESSIQGEMLKSYFRKSGLKESRLSFEAKSYSRGEKVVIEREVIFKIRKSML